MGRLGFDMRARPKAKLDNNPDPRLKRRFVTKAAQTVEPKLKASNGKPK